MVLIFWSFGMFVFFFFFFFFQAEDGIRDHCVTGVQTCALPISQGCARKNDERPNGPSATVCVVRSGASVPEAREPDRKSVV